MPPALHRQLARPSACLGEFALAAVTALRWLAARDKIRNEAIGRAIDHGATLGSPDVSAGGDEEGVSGGYVPIVGRRKPRIKVGDAFGNSAEFDRGAARHRSAVRMRC